jgi:hypothetical protein
MPHAYLPLPLLAADVGCCATLGLDLQRCRGHLFAAQVNQALDRFVRPASYRGPRRITGQRYCYNLCESRVGSATLIAAARGYAFSCRTERSLQGGGGLRACRFDNPTSAAQEGGAYGGRRQSRWRPLRPAALLSALQLFVLAVTARRRIA